MRWAKTIAPLYSTAFRSQDIQYSCGHRKLPQIVPGVPLVHAHPPIRRKSHGRLTDNRLQLTKRLEYKPPLCVKLFPTYTNHQSTILDPVILLREKLYPKNPVHWERRRGCCRITRQVRSHLYTTCCCTLSRHDFTSSVSIYS